MSSASISVRTIMLSDDGYQIEYSVEGSAYADGLAHLTAMTLPASKPFSDIAKEIAELAVEMLEYGEEEMKRRRHTLPVPADAEDPEPHDDEVEGVPS